MRFSGSEAGAAHQRWYRILAEHYDMLDYYAPGRATKAAAFLHNVFRRRGPVRDVLDVACGTFSIDLGLVRKGYRVVGRDLSSDMVRVARRALRRAGLRADVGRGDMRTVAFWRQFDAIVCLGTAFNYLVRARDVRKALRVFHRHLRPEGLLVLDLTNFDAWIDRPKNASAEADSRLPDGTRVAIFSFNKQNRSKTVHTAGMITVVQKGNRIDLGFDEAPLKVWSKETITKALKANGFRPVEWSGDLAPGVPYRRRKDARLVAVATRR